MTGQLMPAIKADLFDAECHGCNKPLADCGITCPEYPDGTRIEFENGTDVYAAWRDDQSSRAAGWPAGDGGKVWCVYGSTVPVTWHELAADFGHCVLENAVRLIPVEADLPKYLSWPGYVHDHAAVDGGQS